MAPVSVPDADWTEPGAFHVAEGVYRIPLPLPNDGLRAVNVYAIQGPTGFTVVDGGWALPETRTALQDAMASLGASLRDIEQFLVTHFHNDHYTNAIAMREEFGTPVSLGIGERDAVEAFAQPGSSSLLWQLRQLRRYGAQELATRLGREGFDFSPDKRFSGAPDTWIEGCSTIMVGSRRLSTLPTPGHTRGHTVFADVDARLLFAGDHVLPHITPSIGFEAAPGELALGAFLASLQAVRALPDMQLLPAHGPVTGSVHARVDQLLEHHATRLDLCAEAVGPDTDTPYLVAGQLPWTRRARRLPELDAFNQMLATIETAAHLDVLVVQGRLTSSEVGGAVRYSVTGAAARPSRAS